MHDQKTLIIDIVECDNQKFNQMLLHYAQWSTRFKYDNNYRSKDRNTVISKNLKNVKNFEENEIA